MPVQLLEPQEAADLAMSPWSYREVGATLHGAFPDGFRHFSASTRLPTGSDLAAAAEAVLRWDVQRRGGFRVTASSERIEPGTVAILSVGLGGLRVDGPVRVVYVVDEPTRRGFGYGTLPGHPVAGEESFLLEVTHDGSITFTVSAFSRDATRLTRLLGPVAHGVQRAITRQYLHTFDRPARRRRAARVEPRHE